LAYDSFGTRLEGQIAAAVGPTRYGKTTGVLVFMTKLAQKVGGELVGRGNSAEARTSVVGIDVVERKEGRQSIRPVVRIQVAPSPTFRGLLMDTIFLMTESMPSQRTSHAKLIHLLATQLINQQTRLIIFDEAHRICREGASAHNALAADVFSSIAKQARVEVALIGREDLDALFISNDELAQMKEFSFRVGPLPFPKNAQAPFCAFLSKFQSNMPFDRPCDIASLEVAQLIHHFTGGAPGSTSLLLQTATKYAILEKLGTVDRVVIGNALKTLRGLDDVDNIFLGEPEPRI
jgi:hypothetical protein